MNDFTGAFLVLTGFCAGCGALVFAIWAIYLVVNEESAADFVLAVISVLMLACVAVASIKGSLMAFEAASPTTQPSESPCSQPS